MSQHKPDVVAENASVLVPILLFFASILFFAHLHNLEAGRPADSLGFLDTAQVQTVVWKNDQGSMFRAADGTEKFIAYTSPVLRVGDSYRVVAHHIPTKWGAMLSFQLEDAK